MNKATESGVRARLFCQTGSHSGQAFFLGEEADVGSAPAAKITIKGARIAQRQARIRYSSGLGAYVLENLSGSNPLLLDGKPVTRPRRLGDLHVLTFAGGHDYIFQILREEVGAATSPGLFLQNVPVDLLEDSKRDPSQRPEPKTSFDQVLPTPAVFAGGDEGGPEPPVGESGGRREAREGGSGESAPQGRASQDTADAQQAEPAEPSRKAPLAGGASSRTATSASSSEASSLEEDTQAGAALPLPTLPSSDAGQTAKPLPASGRSSDDGGSRAAAGEPAGDPPRPSKPSAKKPAAPDGPSAAEQEPVSERSAGKAARAPREEGSQAASPRRSHFLLMVAEEAGTARSYPLGEGKNLVGRMDDCQVILGHNAISRRQAALLVSPRRVIVSDLGGLNPTLVDGRPLQGEVELRPGQELRMGPFRATLIRRREKDAPGGRGGSQA